ncbi:MAG: NHLP leader peptide family RiPP precursor [Candidatus Muiribacteriaceae bacterium]
MSNWTPEEVQSTIDKIKSKAATDKEFRKEVLADPKKVIKEVSGKEVPEDFRLKVIENDPGVDDTFVLPNFVGEELSDEQLDDVAGGRCDCQGQCSCQGSYVD